MVDECAAHGELGFAALNNHDVSLFLVEFGNAILIAMRDGEAVIGELGRFPGDAFGPIDEAFRIGCLREQRRGGEQLEQTEFDWHMNLVSLYCETVKRKTAAPKQVRVLEKTLDILEALKHHGTGAGLAEVSRAVAMPKATVYRILTTLETRGYLDRETDGGYRIAGKLFALQRDQSPRQNLLRVAPPIMERLAAECRETVNLGTLDGGEVVVIATAESPQSVRMASKVGNRRCMHTTGLGKVLLAGMTDAAVKRLVQVKGLPKLTPNSIATQAELLAELQRIRRQGYAVDNQENEMEGRCVAMPLSEAALSISGPVFRMDMKRVRAVLPLLRRACDEISAAIHQ